jgi:hypothetical protein
MIRIKKVIDVIRDKNINLHGLIWKTYFYRVFRIIFQLRNVMWHACILREFTINDS